MYTASPSRHAAPRRIPYLHVLPYWCLGLLLALPLMALAQPRSMDKIIALVDEDVILASELKERVDNVMLQFQGQALPPGVTEEGIREQVLEQLILESIQMQMAERVGLRLDDNTLNQAMEQVARQNGMDFNTFRQVLEQEGLYNQTRAQIGREMVIGEYQNRAVNRRINITRQEIENFLRSEQGESATAPEYRVAHILIPAGDARLTQDSEHFRLGNTLKKIIEEGDASILELAESGRISGLQVSGGDLGFNKPETLPSLFANVLPSLKEGEVSEPFISGSGVHLMQILETRGGSELRLQQTHIRHILISPNEIRTDEQAEAMIHDLLDRIQNGEDFGAIARQNTDDVSSIVSSGDLDWVTEGQMPEDFMDWIDSLPENELSGPFKSEDGWHIAEVLGRRMRDVTEQNRRYQADQILRDRKYEMELENWLTELRDTTYVKILDQNTAPTQAAVAPQDQDED